MLVDKITNVPKDSALAVAVAEDAPNADVDDESESDSDDQMDQTHQQSPPGIYT